MVYYSSVRVLPARSCFALLDDKNDEYAETKSAHRKGSRAPKAVVCTVQIHTADNINVTYKYTESRATEKSFSVD